MTTDNELSDLAQGSTEDAALADVEDIYPLTPMQNGLLFHTLRAEHSGPYVEQFVFDLDGDLDVPRLERSWTEVLGRHPALRTAFVWEGVDEPLQVVLRHCRVPVTRQRLTGRSAEDVEAVFARFLADDRARGFRLAEAPLMRLTVFEHDRGAIVVWTLHHLIMDGWSMPITITEVTAHYRGEGGTLPEPAPFRTFLDWLAGQDRDKALHYWRRELDGMTAVDVGRIGATLPAERRGTATAGRAYLDLTAGLSAGLVRTARAAKVTQSALFQAAWAVLLARHAATPDVVFGAAVAGRPTELPGIETTVGMFINTVPRRVRVDDSAEVGDWLRDVLDSHLDSVPHQHVGLVDVQAVTAVPAGEALFDSIVVFENYPSENPAFDLGGDARLVLREVVEDAGYPLTLTVLPRTPNMRMQLLYDTELFDDETIRGLLGRFEAVLTGLTGPLDQPVGALDAVPADVQRTLAAAEVRVVDERGAIAPVGVAGHVHLRTASLGGVARHRFYDTGLLGALQPDGTLVFTDAVVARPQPVTPGQSDASGAEPVTDYFARPAAEFVRGLWREVLGVRTITPDTDFFKHGGDSLAAVRLIGRLRTTMRSSVVVGAVFADRTLRKLVQRIDTDLGGPQVADERAAALLSGTAGGGA